MRSLRTSGRSFVFEGENYHHAKNRCQPRVVGLLALMDPDTRQVMPGRLWRSSSDDKSYLGFTNFT